MNTVYLILGSVLLIVYKYCDLLLKSGNYSANQDKKYLLISTGAATFGSGIYVLFCAISPAL